MNREHPPKKGRPGNPRPSSRPLSWRTCSRPIPTTRKEVRRCPTLPHPPECSTIGAVSLSYRVRNVTGRFPDAITTETLSTYHTPPTHDPAHPRTNHDTDTQNPAPGGGFVRSKPQSGREHRYTTLSATPPEPSQRPSRECVFTSHRSISTSQLHTLLRFHIWPINPIISRGPLTPQGCTEISS